MTLTVGLSAARMLAYGAAAALRVGVALAEAVLAEPPPDRPGDRREIMAQLTLLQ